MISVRIGVAMLAVTDDGPALGADEIRPAGIVAALIGCVG
jgi:hypothetical protein